MISIYRCIHYPNKTLITFQGEPDDVEALKGILHFTPMASARSASYEKGYYAYLRGNYREENERDALSYLSSNYISPSFELLLFPIDGKVTEDQFINDWINNLQANIKNYFDKQGYIVSQGGLGNEVFRKKPYLLAPKTEPELKAYEGVTYQICLREKCKPVLQVDIAYRFQFKTEVLSLNDVKARFGDNDSEILLRMKQFTTRDTDAIFKLACDFVQSIPPLQSADNLRFVPSPLSAKNSGFDIWLWSHENPVQIEARNNSVVSLAKSIFEERLGLYVPPHDKLILIIVHPSKSIGKFTAFSDWTSISQLAGNTLENALLSTVPVKLTEYKHSDEDNVIVSCENLLNSFSDCIPFFFVVAPPENSDKSNDPDLVQLNAFTGRLENKLRRLRHGGYTVTLQWDKLTEEYDRKYIIENATIKALTVMGAVPWRIRNIACNKDEGIKDICFVGLDLNVNKKIPILGGVIFDGYGILKGYHIAKLENHRGEYIDRSALSSLIGNLLKYYQTEKNEKPNHVIVHRDGLVGDEGKVIVELSAKLNMAFDLIEIRKSGVPRIRQINNEKGTLSRDVAIGSELEKTAYLVNTLVLKEKLSKGKFIFPAPNQIAIRLVVGDTPIKILAAQTYALSLANYNSARRTDSLPITISYADSLVTHASLKENQFEFGKKIDNRNRVYCL
jgi:hypothetical protein